MIFVSGRAQDIHFTLYDMMPLVFNPAESGAFSGTYRVSGIYRDQWLSVTGVPNEYKTPSISVDVPIIKGFRDNDWVGVGLMMLTDKAGSLNLKQSQFKLSAAYHLALDKKGNSILSFGYQTGSVGRKIDVSGWTTDDPKYPDLLEPDTDLTGMTELKSSYIDHVGGLHLRTMMNKKDVLQLGVSVGHIGKPSGGLGAGGGGGVGGGNYEIPMRILLHGSYRAMTNQKLAIIPSVFFQTLGKDTEIMAQAVGEYLFNAEKKIVLKGGLGYRVGDAVQIILGTDIRDLKVTFGYDVNVSSLSAASNSFGGFEISAQLVGIIYKKPDPDPVLFCPRF
jgi:type IX secretion system PorP/SprF family membrane protein